MKKILLIIVLVFCIFQMVVLATAIDIGSLAIDRALYWGSGHTNRIVKGNPANASGKITLVKIYAHSAMTGVEVATFHQVSTNVFTTRDNATIGNISAGYSQHVVSLNVEAGDYLGIHYTSGEMELTGTGQGEVGIWKLNDVDAIPCTSTTFVFSADCTFSLYGTGVTIPPQVTGVSATDGTYTDKVRITWSVATGATGYDVWTGASWVDVGNVTTYDHTTAPAPTITVGSITASDGTSSANVALSNTGASANNGSSISYKVRAYNAAGDGAESATNAGYMGVGALTYQWYRSDGDADSGYGSIDGATASTYNDTAAPAGSVPGTPTGLTASDGTYTDKVTLAWTNVSGGVGAGRYYKCYHTATGAVSGYTGINRGYRKEYTSTNTQVKRDTTELGAIGSLATSYNDTGAAAPTITSGTAAASDGTSADYVTLSVAEESVNNGTTHNYYVRTYNAAGWGNYCAVNTGYRGHGALTYQWQRSAADSDASYSNIDGATTDPYNDTGAPENGDGRYFKCVENATGAAQQTTNSDRGYRIVPYWAGPWNTKTITKWNTKEIMKWNDLE